MFDPLQLHQNKIATLPETFADLTALTSLDLSHNHLDSLPKHIFALPNLTILNISHNEITALPFDAPFSNANSRSHDSGGGSFFAPVIIRATTPLPCLLTLDASHNKILANAIDHDNCKLPILLSKLDLSFNPLGVGNTKCRSLVQELSKLKKLKELKLEAAEIGNGAFASDLFAFSSISLFPALKVLELGETKVTTETVEAAFKTMERELTFDITTEDPPDGVIRVIVGKKVIKEAWELEAERKARNRPAQLRNSDPESARRTGQESVKEVDKESWEIEAEQGLLTEGGRRRARAAAAAAASASKGQDIRNQTAAEKRIVVKEAWEIEAEQGLLTEGGRRRARIAAAAAAAAPKPTLENGKLPNALGNDSQNTSNLSLSSPQYYTPVTQTLTLPSSTPPSKAHSRAISFAAPTSSWSTTSTLKSDIALPTPSLPLALIATQPFAEKLKILNLANRRMDRSLSLPPLADGVAADEPWLPNLEELSLEGCGFGDTVPVTRQHKAGSGPATPLRSNEMLLPLLATLFPSIRTLDLSYNTLTSASIKTDMLSSLILSSPDDSSSAPRKGLKHLRLRGNRLTELEGLQGIAQLFRGNREVPTWKLDELDLRDNEISKLPPELGLMPLDVFLVDGNL